jgi:hypothetical protein
MPPVSLFNYSPSFDKLASPFNPLADVNTSTRTHHNNIPSFLFSHIINLNRRHVDEKTIDSIMMMTKP